MYKIVLMLTAAGLASGYVASQGQINNAHENNYDDTGPGAKRREYVYKTYQHLGDALKAFVNDPDTHLPHYEKAVAIAHLYNSANPGNVYKIGLPVDKFRTKVVPIVLNSFPKNGEDKIIGLPPPSLNVRNGFVSPRLIRQYRPHPQVEFSLDLHDKETGDFKSAEELRDGSGGIHGYYTVYDSNDHGSYPRHLRYHNGVTQDTYSTRYQN